MARKFSNGPSAEDNLGKVYDSHLMKRLLLYLVPYKKHVFTAFILLIFSSFLLLAPPFLTKWAIDEYVVPGDYDGLVKVAFLYVLVSSLAFAFQYFHYYVMHMTGQRVMYDLRKQIFGHLQKMSIPFFNKNPIGRLMTRVTSDVDVLNEMFTSGVVTIFGDIVLITGIISVLFFFNAKLALVTISVVPLLFFAAILFKIKAREGFRDIRIQVAKINASLQESITGMKVVQLFNRQKKNYESFESINESHLKAYIRTILYYSLFFPAVEILSATALALIIWYGGLDVIGGTLSFGVLVAFVQYAQMFYRPIQDLSEKYNVFQGAMSSAERIFSLLDKDEETEDKADAIDLDGIQGDIEFKNVWFAYEDENWVLRDVSFKLKKGEKIAIVGATGAGKTTIISLLERFYEIQKGEILVDNINIVNIKKKSLREHIAVVLQDVFLFSGSVRDNITLNNESISQEKLIQAAKDVNAHRFISRLENQYDHEIREQGNNLSAGQRQLISFARALVYNPEILVLDEATSNIDTETELLIQSALHHLMEGRTSIIIAHRLSTIKYVDRIIVMHKGEVREMGSHQELLSKKGIYYKLYQLQYKEQEAVLNGALDS